MKWMELGSAMVTKSPSFTPLAAIPRAMRLLRLCSSRQESVTSSQVTASASGFSSATRASAAAMEMGAEPVCDMIDNPLKRASQAPSTSILRGFDPLSNPARSTFQEIDHRGQGGAVLKHEEMATLEECELRTFDPRRHFFLRGGERDAVIAPRRDHHGTRDFAETIIGVVMRTRFKLAMITHGAKRLILERIVCCHHHELLIHFRIGLLPLGVPARVGDRDHEARAFLAPHMLDCVERIGGTTRTARRGAGQHQAFDFRGMPQNELLRHHAAERDADHARA